VPPLDPALDDPALDDPALDDPAPLIAPPAADPLLFGGTPAAAPSVLPSPALPAPSIASLVVPGDSYTEQANANSATPAAQQRADAEALV